MARKRLREWDTLVYNFWCRPIGEQNIDSLIAYAKKQHATWNGLVRAWHDCIEQCRGLTREDMAPLWKTFWEDIQTQIKQAPLGRSGRAEMGDRFNAAIAKVTKDRKEYFALLNQGRIGPEKKPPILRFKSERFIEDFHLSHHDGVGGLPVSRAFAFHNTRRWRFGAPQGLPEPAAYRDELRATRRERLQTFFFGLEEGIQLSLETIIHRSLPEDALVKAVGLTGRFNRYRAPLRDAHGNIRHDRRWQFSLQITLETPPKPRTRHDGMVAGLDLGWRVMGDRIRIGMLVDSTGNQIELSIPLRGHLVSQRNRGIARMLRHAAAKKGREIEQYEGFDGLREVDHLIGLGVEGIKSLMEEILPSRPAGWTQMHQRGLRKLLREIRDEGAEANPEALAALQAWECEDRRLQGIAVTLEGYCLRQRRKAYELMACWLANRYRAIIWEDGLGVKKLGEISGEKKAERKRKRAEGELPPLSAREAVIEAEDRIAQEAGKYRRWVALGEFRTILAWQARKAGCTILPGYMPGTTRICWICGEDIDGDQTPVDLTCPNGHIWDQDINAARNLLDQLPGLMEKTGESFVPQQKGDPVEIPERLKYNLFVREAQR